MQVTTAAEEEAVFAVHLVCHHAVCSIGSVVLFMSLLKLLCSSERKDWKRCLSSCPVP